MKRIYCFWLMALSGFLFVTLSLAACSKESSQKRPQVSMPVTVDKVVRKNVPVQLRAIGNVQAHATVTVKAQVGGELVGVHFIEGEDVKKGDLLFTLDKRPYEAALNQIQANLERDSAQVQQARANLERDMSQVKQAQANLERDQAQARNAEADANRYKDLVGQGIVPQNQYESFRTTAEAMQAAVRADRAAKDNAEASVRASRAAVDNAEAAVRASRAAVDTARIQLGYCTIRSPIDGRTGSLIVQKGNLIKANDINLVIINQISPIYVVFSVPEQFLPDIKKYMAEGTLRVEAIIPNDSQEPEVGGITFIDNAVDSSTGTIKMKGTFPNQLKRLWPGQFVNVLLTLTTEPNAIVVPSQAIQTGQAGQYVFVVTSDLTVESRPVKVSRTFDGESVIGNGLKQEERVVTDGQLRLFPGAKVEIKGSASASVSQKDEVK